MLTFDLSLCGAVVAEKALQQSFLGAPGLQSLFLHQPQQSACLISPRQSPHLTHAQEDAHKHSSGFRNAALLSILCEIEREKHESQKPNHLNITQTKDDPLARDSSLKASR